MPFKALHNSNVVWPDQVNKKQYYDCIACGEKLTVVKSHRRNGNWVSRHFRHISENDCGGPETNEHKLMKYVASRKLSYTFDSAIVKREVKIPGTDRIGDVFVELPETNPEIGDGIVAEIQHKNENKDKHAVSMEYLRNGYSVVWLTKFDFTDDWMDVELDITSPWPQAVPHRYTWRDPPVGVMQLKNMDPAVYPIKATIPFEYIESKRDELKIAWTLASENYDFDVTKKLEEDNATKTCGVCGNDAEWYLLQIGVLSGYRCSNHVPWATDDSDVQKPEQ